MADRTGTPPDASADDLGDPGAGREGRTELVPPDADHHRLAKGCRLSIVHGASAGKTWAITSPRTLIGTEDSCDVRLDDRTVSRYHCELVVDTHHASIRDLDSSNGTRVNGVRLDRAELPDGCTLTLGLTRLRFEYSAEPIAVPISRSRRFGGLVGQSTAMRAVFATLERAAESDVTVLVLGESGTGKEVTAASLHDQSERRDGPFVVFDCSAIPAQLMESELFGHVRGAFSGATEDRVGALEAADGGTIFFDEIGELGLDVQPVLLRALESHQVRRVGSNTWADVDVRVIAATNRNLLRDVNANRFRQDLYYRLAVFEVELPPLRDRPDDLPVLVHHLLDNFGGDRVGVALLRTDEFIADLARHPWTGNVRELRNHLERCLVMREPLAPPASTRAGGAGGEADAGRDDRLDGFDWTAPYKEAREVWQSAFEREYLTRVVERNNGNVSAAAREAVLDRVYFYRLLRRHGLR